MAFSEEAVVGVEVTVVEVEDISVAAVVVLSVRVVSEGAELSSEAAVLLTVSVFSELLLSQLQSTAASEAAAAAAKMRKKNFI